MSLKTIGLSSICAVLAGGLALAPLPLPAQTPAAAPAARQFTYSQMQCSDVFAPRVQEQVPRVIGARGGLLETMFSTGDILYLNGAAGLQPGDAVRLLRVVNLGQEEEQFPGQAGLLHAMGAYVVAVGQAQVLRVNRRQVATARITFSCQPAEVGDFAAAWHALPSPSLPTAVRVNWTAPIASNAAAQILVMGRDHAGLAGRGDEVYLTGGAAAGARVGQAWTVFRTRRSPSNSQFQTAAEGLPVENMGAASLRNLPEPADILGRLVIIRVEPRSATAILTAARAPIRAGDEAVPVPPAAE